MVDVFVQIEQALSIKILFHVETIRIVDSERVLQPDPASLIPWQEMIQTRRYSKAVTIYRIWPILKLDIMISGVSTTTADGIVFYALKAFHLHSSVTIGGDGGIRTHYLVIMNQAL